MRKYKLDVSYPAEEYPSKDVVMDNLVGRRHEASGMGFGMRDLSWYFKNKATRDARYRRLKKLSVECSISSCIIDKEAK